MIDQEHRGVVGIDDDAVVEQTWWLVCRSMQQVDQDGPEFDGAAGPTLLRATGIHKAFGPNRVLCGVDLSARAGDIVAVVGTNGCGKSTLLRILADQDHADEGVVEITGSVGFAPQQGGLDDHLRPIEHFELFGAARGLSTSEARAQGLRLSHELGWAAAEAPVAGELSVGTRQKLNVVTAMLGDPDILLLDEPGHGFDARSGRRFWELLEAWVGDRRAAIVTSHQRDGIDRATSLLDLEMVDGR